MQSRFFKFTKKCKCLDSFRKRKFTKGHSIKNELKRLQDINHKDPFIGSPHDNKYVRKFRLGFMPKIRVARQTYKSEKSPAQPRP
jgi:hypothetical protein